MSEIFLQGVQFLSKGGVLIIPILFCSVISFMIIMERVYRFRKIKNIEHGFASKVLDLIIQGKLNEAYQVTIQTHNPIAHIMAVAIKRSEDTEISRDRISMEKTLAYAGQREVRELERYLPTLATIGNIAPLLGLMGTVTGMIKAFIVIQEMGGKVNATVLAGGIWEAMLTTAMGLAVALPTVVAYNYLVGKVNGLAADIQDIAVELLDTLERKKII